MIATASPIAKRLLYRIFRKIHDYITLNCRVVHKLYDSKVIKGIEWKAAIPIIPTVEREQEIIQYRKTLTYENCWTPKAEGTVQGSLICWTFDLKKKKKRYSLYTRSLLHIWPWKLTKGKEYFKHFQRARIADTVNYLQSWFSLNSELVGFKLMGFFFFYHSCRQSYYSNFKLANYTK